MPNRLGAVVDAQASAAAPCQIDGCQYTAAFAKGMEEAATLCDQLAMRAYERLKLNKKIDTYTRGQQAVYDTARELGAAIRALPPSSWVPAGSGWQPTSADDIRAAGWSVAVHNDYRQDGKTHTFWLFVKEGQAVKGEGETDFAALEQVRAQIDLLPTPPHEPTGETE